MKYQDLFYSLNRLVYPPGQQNDFLANGTDFDIDDINPLWAPNWDSPMGRFATSCDTEMGNQAIEDMHGCLDAPIE